MITKDISEILMGKFMSGANTVQFRPNICIMNQKSKDETQGFVFPICSRCQQFKIVFLM